ncbi:hypothetical protein C8T65DRAFT_751307 [Cerioporus squamosus]|nr:hypothetical protein C8T65DRAFT_751307 [Cerioporus squamosus]
MHPKCSVCFEEYSNDNPSKSPALIPVCGHIVCQECILHVVSIGNERCPTGCDPKRKISSWLPLQLTLKAAPGDNDTVAAVEKRQSELNAVQVEIERKHVNLSATVREAEKMNANQRMLIQDWYKYIARDRAKYDEVVAELEEENRAASSALKRSAQLKGLVCRAEVDRKAQARSMPGTTTSGPRGAVLDSVRVHGREDAPDGEASSSTSTVTPGGRHVPPLPRRRQRRGSEASSASPNKRPRV